MKINETKFGFTLIGKKHVKEINSDVRVFRHESGAELMHIENDDNNKVFTISFRTPPSNSNGIPHILEHSVLCGSRKFPVKEPFVELLKGSLNTFLNAMTFSDKTMYPVASTNEKDFVNLMDVYLDAVFHPNIYEQPEIFMQEGWHHELENPEDDVTYKGVVYNEMKGAFSSPEQILFRNIQHSLFPDHVYGHESGGDPDEITNLTYDEFLSFHEQYYHPSNSKIMIYGDGDFVSRLKFLHEKYLNEYSLTVPDSKIPLLKTYEPKKDVEMSYPISEGENDQDKTYLSMNYVVGTSNDLELGMAMGMLEYILMESSAAPLKNALNESRLGKDVFGSYNNLLQQPVFSVILKNSNKTKRTEFQTLVNNTLKKIVEEGLDKKLIEAAINSTEFHLREADFGSYPKGLVYIMQVGAFWNYYDDPIQSLEFEQPLEKIKTALTTSYFEDMIQKYLLDNPHQNVLTLTPVKNLAEDKVRRDVEILANYKETLKQDEVLSLVEQTKQLKLKQVTPDSEEALETIPRLTISDLNKEAEVLPIEVNVDNGITVLNHDINTSGITYLKLFFDTRVISQDDIQYLPLLTSLIGEVSTENYSYADLSNEINIHTGGIGTSAANIVKYNDASTYYPKLIVKGKSVHSKLNKMLELIDEMIHHTTFDDKNKIRELIQESKSRQEMSISQAGHTFMMSRLFSYLTQSGFYNEKTGGLDYYKFITDLEKNYDDRYEDLVHKLKEIYGKVFTTKNMIVSITRSNQESNDSVKEINDFLTKINSTSQSIDEYEFDLTTQNEGFMTPANVQYVSKGFNYRELGYDYTGSMTVFSRIAGLDYLWNRIRVQGGAYGAFSIFAPNGNVFMGTYRDPNLKESLDAFDQIAEYYKQFETDDTEMTKYIIGAVSQLDTPLTPSAKGNLASTRYISQISYEDIQRNREEILNTNQKQIREIAEIVEKMMKEDRYCVIGNEERIKSDGHLFDELVKVFE